MNVEALLQDREDAPSGEDLEYDPAFTELEIAAMPGEERQVGDEIIAGEDPDYKEVAQKAEEIMERSHDLRAGVFAAEAALRLKGLPGFAEATTYIRGLLEDRWETCHPMLDEDDDDDPTMRVNAVLALADERRILAGMRRVPLTDSRMFGAVSLRDIAVAEGDMTAPSDMDRVPDTAGIAAAFQDTDDDQLREISEAIQTAIDNIEAINEQFVEQTPGQGPDLDPLTKLLRQARGTMSNHLGEASEDAPASDDEEEEAMDGAPAHAPARASGGGAINSSTDVINALDRIIGYYERSEPSSPVPILLGRAKTLVNADFLTIVKNMAPLGVENVNLIGGLEDNSDDDDDY